MAQETEYTGAGKHLQPQLTFARRNGIELKFGDPAEEVAGQNIIFPAKPSLLKARDADLDHMRRSLIRHQTANAAALTAADIAYLAQEVNRDEDYVRAILKELGK